MPSITCVKWVNITEDFFDIKRKSTEVKNKYFNINRFIFTWMLFRILILFSYFTKDFMYRYVNYGEMMINKLIYLSLFITTLNAQQPISVIFDGNNTKLAKFEIEFIKNVLDVIQKKSNQKINIKYLGVKDFKSSFTVLDSGNKDEVLLINNVSITESRKKSHDFSIPYIYNKYALMSNKNYFFKNGKKIKRVGVRIGGFAETLSKDLSSEFPVQVKGYKSLPIAKKVLGEEIDMILSDHIMVWVFNLKLVKIYRPELSNDFAIMYKKGSKLKAKIDAAILEYKKTSGFNQLIKKHFGKSADLFFKS